MYNTLILMSMPEGGDGGGMSTILLWGGVFLIFYLFMIRPQITKQKKQENFKKTVGKGDNVVTVGGVHGKIIEAQEDKTNMVIQTEGGHKLRVERGAISQEFTKAAYPSEEDKAKAKKK